MRSVKQKKVFDIACLRQKLGLHTEFCEFRKKRILKICFFHWVKKLFKLNQIWYRKSLVFVECKTKEVIAMACLGKKLGFHTEIWKFANNKFEKKFFFGSRSCSNNFNLIARIPLCIRSLIRR